MVERLRTLSVEHLKVLMVEHLKVLSHNLYLPIGWGAYLGRVPPGPHFVGFEEFHIIWAQKWIH